MQEGVLESRRVAIAPSPEVIVAVEQDGLHGMKPAPWGFFAFDIEASDNALEDELNFAAATAGIQRPARGRNDSLVVGGVCSGRWRISAASSRSVDGVHGAPPRRERTSALSRQSLRRFDALNAAEFAASAL